jgi:hypothetical protein
MRIDLILAYTMLSVELSIGWLKIRCARMRAHIVSLIGAWVHLSTTVAQPVGNSSLLDRQFVFLLLLVMVVLSGNSSGNPSFLDPKLVFFLLPLMAALAGNSSFWKHIWVSCSFLKFQIHTAVAWSNICLWFALPEIRHSLGVIMRHPNATVFYSWKTKTSAWLFCVKVNWTNHH